jgi:hypothetical protein
MPRLRSLSCSLILAAAATSLGSAVARGQENYEIQVYPAATVGRGVTMFELHSNYTLNGSRSTSPLGELATNHALHETIEITHGFTQNTELGFYWFMARPDNGQFQWVGTHIRPRFSVPEEWGWPVGVSISQEFGWAKKAFSPDQWTYELRPIIDKTMGPWYVSLNPVLGKSLRGPTASQAFDFTPNVNVGYDVTKVVNVALEYYGATGTIKRIDPLADQEHDLYAAVNLDLGPMWEFNAGYGFGLTGAGDKHIIKMILGRRVGGK